jgi:hypothetical protein
MSSNVRPIAGKSIVQGGDGGSVVVDHWAQVVSVAQPTLNAIPKLRESREWLAAWKNRDPGYIHLMLNLERYDEFAEAEARIARVPDMAFLRDAGRLFDDAVRKSAPEPWLHLALGTMLAGMPNATNVAVDYSISIVDTLMHDDEEIWEKDCEPGFSAPIFVSAIRKVRREQKFVPSAAEIFEACKIYRKRFRELEGNANLLISVRENAEAVLNEWGDVMGESKMTPFMSQEMRKKHNIPDDDSDCPF